MNEQDIKNYKIIEGLVENYFSLDYESNTKFKKLLWEPDIDPVYKEIVGEDLRFSVDIPEHKKEQIDDGWRLFQELYPDFARRHTYEEFNNNLFLIGKSELKTQKALFSYYKDKKGVFGLYDDDSDSLLMEAIRKDMKEINNKKLTKRSIQLVLSLNFADWFLSATAEGWRTCISLESPHRGCFWTGLPGLIGDKNRSIVYITDGRNKIYSNIIINKMLLRSWVMLDEFDRLNLVRMFPSELINIRTISGLFGLNFRQLDEEYMSKYSLNPLFFNNGDSCFIYKDYVGFNKDLFMVNPDHYDSSFEEDIEDGYEHFKKEDYINNNIKLGFDELLNFEHGFQELVITGKKVEDYLIKEYKCYGCGEPLRAVCASELYQVEDEVYCPSCYHSNFVSCCRCSVLHERSSEEIIEFEFIYYGIMNYRYICKHCYEDNEFCSHCGQIYSRNFLYYVEEEDKYVCPVCKEIHYSGQTYLINEEDRKIEEKIEQVEN